MLNNRRSYPKILAVLVSVGVLMGCVPPADIGPHTSTPVVPVVISTPTLPIIAPTFSATLTEAPSATALASPTGISTPTPAATPETVCPAKETELPVNFHALGLIIFTDYATEQLYRLSLPNLILTPFLPDVARGGLGEFYVSPDSKWLAFIRSRLDNQRVSRSDLILTTSSGQDWKIIPWTTENWADLHGWLADSQQLFISPPFDYSRLPYKKPDEMIVFNPFTGEQQLLTPSFPYSGNPLFDYWKYVGQSVIYSPNLSQVAYLDDEQTLVLWDIQQSQEVWRYVDPWIMADNPAPVWTPDGHTMAQAVRISSDGELPDDTTGFEFLFISNNGEITHSQPFPHYYGLEHSFLWWSPDGRYLVFYWTPSNEEKFRLMLWDTYEQKFLDYCITHVTSEPVWSPDSRQFIISVSDPAAASTETTYQNLLVDIEQNKVFQVDDVTFPVVAWIKLMP